MKLGIVAALACTLLALSACVLEPYGGGPGGYYGNQRVQYQGEGFHGSGRSQFEGSGYNSQSDYGHRVWGG